MSKRKSEHATSTPNKRQQIENKNLFIMPNVLLTIIADYLDNYVQQLEFVKFAAASTHTTSMSATSLTTSKTLIDSFAKRLHSALIRHALTADDATKLIKAAINDGAIFGGSIVLEAIFNTRYPQSDIDIFHLDRRHLAKFLWKRDYHCVNILEKDRKLAHVDSGASQGTNTAYQNCCFVSGIYKQRKDFNTGRKTVLPLNAESINLLKLNLNSNDSKKETSDASKAKQSCDNCPVLIPGNDNCHVPRADQGPFTLDTIQCNRCETLIEYVKRFDFDICRIAYNPADDTLFIEDPEAIHMRTSKFNDKEYCTLSVSDAKTLKLQQRITKYKDRGFSFPLISDFYKHTQK
jgi:hypothetical protein